MRKLFRALALVAAVELWALAGAVYTNDTGAIAYGFRIAFEAPVIITSHAEVFPEREPEGEAVEFTFTGGEVPPGGTFWLSWRPTGVKVAGYEWLSSPSFEESPKKLAQAEEKAPEEMVTKYTLELASSDGEAVLRGTIYQRVPEQIPFIIRFEPEFADLDELSFEWEIAGMRSNETSPEFLLPSQGPYDVDLTIRDSEGHVFSWTHSGIEVLLHNKTRIVLDATKYVPADEIASVEWSTHNWDPADSPTFPIANPSSPVTTLTSEWPNVLQVELTINTKDGRIIQKSNEALIYFRDGSPFEIRSVAATIGGPIPRDMLPGIFEEMFDTLRRLGVNSVTTAINWWYGYPDAYGNFTIQPLYAETFDDKDHRGYTPDNRRLELYFDMAQQEGFNVFVQLLHYPYQNEPGLNQDYHPSGWGRYKGFMLTRGWMYSENGWEHMLLTYPEFFQEHGVDGVFLDAESGYLEAHGGSISRRFFERIIAKYREVGFTGELSYAFSYAQNHDYPELPPMRLQNLNPYVCGIPWTNDEIHFIGLTFYPTWSYSFDATLPEMYEEALRQIEKYLVPMSKKYGKPLFIADSTCTDHDGCAIRPIDISWARTRPADPQEFLSWFAALYRAFAYMNQTRETPLVIGITTCLYGIIPEIWMKNRPPEWGVRQSYLNDANRRQDLQKLVQVYYSDKPFVAFAEVEARIDH